MLRRLTLLVLPLITTLACSDDVPETTSAGTSGGGMVNSGGGGGMGVGGNAGGSGGATPTCGPDIAFTPHFECDVNALVDMTDESNVTIGYGFVAGAFIYEPKCLHVCAGTTVTMEPLDGTNFQIHPLQGGEPPGDDDSPFGFLDDGDVTTASFSLTDPGSYPYYCIAHLGSGMTGAVYVQ